MRPCADAIQPKGLSLPREVAHRLPEILAATHTLVGAVRGPDKVMRLTPLEPGGIPQSGQLPLIPPKKYLLPSRQILWREGPEGTVQASDRPMALLGLAPCDLWGIAYLDRVFADDPLYRRRRRRLLLIGAECVPGDSCFCPPRSSPPPFDLFLGASELWVGSQAGEAALGPLRRRLRPAPGVALPSCLKEARGPAVPADLDERFRAAHHSPLWREVGETCLSCGACSAVCPTCYCYDVVDRAAVDGSVIRSREWDNCFFADHARVAGGHNFRPSRTERLRFRFEHKMLGFGALRGASSCVGCGRCKAACPVDIDIAELLEKLRAKEV